MLALGDSVNKESARDEKAFKVNIEKTKIETHLTEQYDDQPGTYKLPFPQISDHYGISTIISIE